MTLLSADFIGLVVGFVLSLAVLSYLLGDNPAYRLAVHIFVGATAAYVTLIVWHNVLFPQLFAPFLQPGAFDPGQRGQLIVPLVGALLAVLLLFKLTRSASGVGNVSVAYLVGVGAAVSVGGAITGTLFPQSYAAAFNVADLSRIEIWLGSGIALVGTIATLVYFTYWGQPRPGGKPTRPLPLELVAVVGRGFLGAAFGVMYAGAIAASLAFLAERLESFGGMFQTLMQMLGGA